MVFENVMKKGMNSIRGGYIAFAVLLIAIIASVCLPQESVMAAGSDHDASATKQQLESKPGVYYVSPDNNSGNIRIPSISRDKLASEPTDEMPAIIMGAAVNYEVKTGPTSFKPKSGKDLVPPYSYFRWSTIQETVQDADGNQTTHTKLSGFDGSYYIIRINMERFISGKTGGNYVLHVKQEDNKALMTATGAVIGNDSSTFCYMDAATQKIIKVGSYKLDANALKDKGGSDPYFDVVVLSSSKLVAGAEGDKDPYAGDIGLKFYIDQTFDYNERLNIPNPLPTMSATAPYTASDGTVYTVEGNFLNDLAGKFFRDENYNNSNAADKAKYTVKGSDLEIDVGIDQNEFKDSEKEIASKKNGIDWISEKMKFWSMTKAFENKGVNNHTITMICEVPVLQGLSLTGNDDRAVILDVNSFDVQVANDVSKDSAGITVGGASQLRIMDSSNTAGAELAIGNNAKMLIKKGGILIIDESCTGEVEYDPGTKADPSQVDKTTMNGSITIEDGGKIVNHGVINIEGAEAKPLDPASQTQQATDMKSADIAILYNGILDNYGCISLKGVLYVLGTLNNYGQYNDMIVATDPDKGNREYHRGIQLTWKDVVNDPNRPVTPGILNIGIDSDGNIETRALVNNQGDIVLVPGIINLYGTLSNSGSNAHVYLCYVNEAVIPVVNPDNPLEVERRVSINPPKESVFNNKGTFTGVLEKATVEVLSNGVLGKLTPLGLYNETTASTGSTADNTSNNRSAGRVLEFYDRDSSSSSDSSSDSSKPEEKSYGSGKSKGYYKKTGKSTVEYTGSAEKMNAKSLIVPDRVKIGKKYYKVTAVADYAFTGYSDVRVITIGKNVKSINPNAFNGCKNLTTLKIMTKLLTAKSIHGCLEGTKVSKILVMKSAYNKYPFYKKIFTKKNTGSSKKLTVKKG